MPYKSNPDMLFDGAQFGHLPTIRNAHSLGTDMNCRDAHGLTALHIAAIYQTSVVVRTLIDLGANHSSLTAVKQTPLYYAARYDNSDALHELLDAGASIDAQDEIGNTALHVAVYMGNTATVQELLLRGASKLLENRDGHTAEDFAASRRFHDITPFVTLTAEEKAKRVKWVNPDAPVSTRPKRKHKHHAAPEWHKPAPDQPPTNPYPISSAEREELESIPIYFIEPVGQDPVEYEGSALSEWP
jgi:hypothetical protein